MFNNKYEHSIIGYRNAPPSESRYADIVGSPPLTLIGLCPYKK